MTWAHVVGISGGKDSTAAYLTALERGFPFEAYAADTGNEHPWTVEAIQTLGDRSGGPPVKMIRADFAPAMKRKAERLPERWSALGIDDAVIRAAVDILAHPTGNPFLDLCALKGRFPSAQARFCTEEIKVFPFQRQVYEPLLIKDRTVVSWQGVRAGESPARALLKPLQELHAERGRLFAYRPLHGLSVDDVFAIHRRHGVKPNPLYAEGLSRVGCFPCVMCRKHELALIVRRYPEVKDRLRAWEATVSAASRTGSATFFYIGRDPLWLADGSPVVCHTKDGIDRMSEWAVTDRGGRQFLLDLDDPEDRALVSADYATACNAWGQCE